jgi:hypothetical protein
MKKITVILAGIIAASSLLSCSSTHISQKSTNFNLAKADYKVSGDTTGHSCVNYYFGFPFVQEDNLKNKYGYIGNPITLRSLSAARYDAITKVKDATYFVESRVETSYRSKFLWLISESCSTVYGKAITVTGSSNINN